MQVLMLKTFKVHIDATKKRFSIDMINKFVSYKGNMDIIKQKIVSLCYI